MVPPEQCDDNDIVAPLVVSLWMDERYLDYFDALRKKHFPENRNYLQAHVTLFHALPAIHRMRVLLEMQTAASSRRDLIIDITAVRFLGAGVAFELNSNPLMELRHELASAFKPWLTRQDAQKWMPHITIQNKVKPQIAKALYMETDRDFKPGILRAKGLDVHFYCGGPWRLWRKVAFGNTAGTELPSL